MSKLYQDIGSQQIELLDVHQAAKFLSVGVSTIRRWAQQKKIHGLKVGTRGDWRFSKKDLLNVVKSNSNKRVEEIL